MSRDTPILAPAIAEPQPARVTGMASGPRVYTCGLAPRPGRSARAPGEAAAPERDGRWAILLLDADADRAAGVAAAVKAACPAAGLLLRAATPGQARGLLAGQTPGLALVCGRPADAAILQAVESLHRAWPDTAIVVLADEPGEVSDAALGAALAAGAQECLPLDDAAAARLHHTLRHALARAHTGAAWREATAAYRDVFEQSVDGIFLSAPDGRVIAANPAACRMFGYTQEELRALGRAAVVDPGDPTVAAAIDERRRTGRFAGELVFRRADGSRVPVEVSSQVFRDTAGTELTSLFVRDISARREAEAALAASESKYRGLVQGLHDGVFVCDAGDRLLEVTDRLCELVGYSRGELLRMCVAELVDPADAAEVPLRRAELARAGTLVTRRVLRKKDGATLPVEVASVLLGDGRVECIVRDMTERDRRDAEKALLDAASQVIASSRGFREVVRDVARLTVPALADWCVIDVLDDDGAAQVVEVAGASDEIRGLVTAILERYPHDATPERHPVGQVLHTGEPVLVPEIPPGRLAELATDEAHLRLLRRLRPASAIVAPLVAHGRILGAMILTRGQGGRAYSEHDLEPAVELARRVGLGVEKARLHERLEQAVEAREKVLGYVAHDLRGPLAGIALHAEFLLDHEVEPAQRRGCLETVLDCTSQLNGLIQDLLDAQSIQGGRLRVEPARQAVAPLVDKAVEPLRIRAEEAGVALRVEVADALPPVHADPSRVMQVFSNLVGNALKFTPRGGEMAVRASSVGAEILFSVADTGRGIDPAELPRLFDAFWQGRGTHSGGAGLGLTIVRGIVEAHGGRIWAASEPGRGSTFFFTLPCASSGQAAAAPAAAPAAGPAADDPAERAGAGSTGTVRVLLVDDHSVVRRGLRELLAGAGHRFELVGEAATGDAAVEMAAALHPDVVLMDLHLPGIDGIEATRRIRAECPATRVLVLTAEAEENCLMRVLEAGGSGLVRKTSAHLDLYPALETVAAGRVFLDAAGSQVLLRGVAHARRVATPDSLAELAPPERDVAILTARGFTSREIAERLHLAPKTVDTYRSQVMRKLGLEHRAELVRLALRLGVLRPD